MAAVCAVCIWCADELCARCELNLFGLRPCRTRHPGTKKRTCSFVWGRGAHLGGCTCWGTSQLFSSSHPQQTVLTDQ
jgi:hypothetical protein